MNQRKSYVLAAIATAALLNAAASRADDRATIDRTQIIGNRELPKVLYIVPWKKPVAGDLSGRQPKACSMRRWRRSIGRFRRQVRYSTLTKPDNGNPTEGRRGRGQPGA